jgi:hypothetical protein
MHYYATNSGVMAFALRTRTLIQLFKTVNSKYHREVFESIYLFIYIYCLIESSNLPYGSECHMAAVLLS